MPEFFAERVEIQAQAFDSIRAACEKFVLARPDGDKLLDLAKVFANELAGMKDAAEQMVLGSQATEPIAYVGPKHSKSAMACIVPLWWHYLSEAGLALAVARNSGEVGTLVEYAKGITAMKRG